MKRPILVTLLMPWHKGYTDDDIQRLGRLVRILWVLVPLAVAATITIYVVRALT